MLDRLEQIDTQFFFFINGFHSPLFDNLMWHISGKLEWLPLYFAFLIFVILKYKRQSIWVLLAVAVLITLSDTISARIIKDVVERYRPSRDMELQGLVHIVNNYKGGSYGFISSHAANSFALATFLYLLIRNRWLTAGLFFWAIIVSYSRIYLGVHYPGDVIGGALLGSLLAFLIFRVFNILMAKYYRQST